MVGMINEFITDKTKIYLAYKIDGHIYRHREREREREIQYMYIGGKYNIYLHEP
jgi:uncharacterized protein YjaZ